MSMTCPSLIVAFLAALFSGQPATACAVPEALSAPREGAQAGVPPKPMIAHAPDQARAVYAMKVEAAWLLAGGLPGSEPEAGA